MPILSVKISNHPTFAEVERYCNVTLQMANSNARRFEFWFEISFIYGDIDISNSLPQPKNNHIFTDENKKQTLYDSVGIPIPNPEWDGISEDWYDMYMWVDGWTLISTLINQPTNIVELIEMYILINDSEGYFDE